MGTFYFYKGCKMSYILTLPIIQTFLHKVIFINCCLPCGEQHVYGSKFDFSIMQITLTRPWV